MGAIAAERFDGSACGVNGVLPPCLTKANTGVSKALPICYMTYVWTALPSFRRFRVAICDASEPARVQAG